MIDIRALVRLLGGQPAALWKQWVEDAVIGVETPDLLMSDQDDDVQAAIERRRQTAIARRQGAIAVVPVRGMIIPRANIYEAVGWATSVETLVALTRAAVQDPQTKVVVQVYDSPGGSVAGVPEGFSDLYALRGDTPIVAVSEHLMASAAYWLASAADEIVAAPSALTGSIGVFMLHMDYAEALKQAGMTPTFIFAGEHKVDGNAYEPLSDDARDYYQGLVDDVYRQFTADVGLGRGVSASTVRGEAFGHGRVLTASAAKAAGMIDQVRTLSETLSAYGVEPQQGSRALAPERRRRSLALMERGVVGSE